MTELARTASSIASAKNPIGPGSALFIALLIVVGLGVLAFWPNSAWSPPKRPHLRTPIVFDEFVNQPIPALASSSAAETAARHQDFD